MTFDESRPDPDSCPVTIVDIKMIMATVATKEVGQILMFVVPKHDDQAVNAKWLNCTFDIVDCDLFEILSTVAFDGI